MTTTELERNVKREFLFCPNCKQHVHTKPTEGVPAQALRNCNECGDDFFMDLDAKPMYERRSIQ